MIKFTTVGEAMKIVDIIRDDDTNIIGRKAL